MLEAQFSSLPSVPVLPVFLTGADPCEWAASLGAAPADREATRPQGATLTR